MWFRISVWILVAIVIIYVAVYDLISIFGCKPITTSWDLSLISSASCIDQLTKCMALSMLNIIIDVFTLLLSIPVILRLQMPRRPNISVCAIFATGSLYNPRRFECLPADIFSQCLCRRNSSNHPLGTFDGLDRLHMGCR